MQSWSPGATFRAFSQHYQKDENEKSEPGVVSRQQADFSLDFTLQLAAGLHHEDDHRDHEEGRDQHDPAFEDVLVQVRAGDNDGDANAAQESGRERRIHSFAQFLTADLGQIGQSDADNQGGFDPLAESDNKSL